MNADRLLALWDRIADAPEAAPRLRRFVLDLAVRGKLVEQDPADEPAAVLLERIAAEKARLVKAGKIKRKAAQNPKMVEAPHGLPASWSWVSLGTAFLYDAGAKRDPKSLDASRWLLELEDIEKETGRLLGRIAVSDRGSKSTKSEFQVDDILYGKLRPYLTKVLVANEPGYSTTEIVAIRPFLPLCSEYCALAFRSPYFVDYVTRLGQGTKMPRLRTEDAVVSPFPLPPLAEQGRIVARVDQLMTLLDRLEAARAAREATRDRLATASLARLTALDAETSDATFALETLPALTTRPDQIKPVRQAILNLAVRGKLVAQDPADEPASSLADAIRSEIDASKKRIIEPDMTLIDISMPSNWVWQSLDAIITDGPQNGLSPRKSERIDTPKAITLTATTSGTFDPKQFKHVDVKVGDAARYWLEPGDLLFQRGNTREYVGMAAVYNGSGGEYLFPDLIMRVKLSQRVDIRFVHLWCVAPVARNYLSSNATGAQKTMPKINQGILRALPVPLPPLAEQHRIVAKVDALMALCDRLEAALHTADTTRARLLDSLLHEALDPAADGALEAAQ